MVYRTILWYTGPRYCGIQEHTVVYRTSILWYTGHYHYHYHWMRPCAEPISTTQLSRPIPLFRDISLPSFLPRHQVRKLDELSQRFPLCLQEFETLVVGELPVGTPPTFAGNYAHIYQDDVQLFCLIETTMCSFSEATRPTMSELAGVWKERSRKAGRWLAVGEHACGMLVGVGRWSPDCHQVLFNGARAFLIHSC